MHLILADSAFAQLLWLAVTSHFSTHAGVGVGFFCQKNSARREEIVSTEATERIKSDGALARRRLHFDDPLFLRMGRGVQPTVRAMDIAALLIPALRSIEVVIKQAARRGG